MKSRHPWDGVVYLYYLILRRGYRVIRSRRLPDEDNYEIYLEDGRGHFRSAILHAEFP